MDTFLLPVGRPRRSRARGFDLIQLAIVVLLIGLLSGVAWAVLVPSAQTARDRYAEQTLVAIDVTARELARTSRTESDPSVFLRDVVGSDDPADGAPAVGCPVGGTVTVPAEECALEDGDRNRFRLLVDDTPGAGQVLVLRFGSCLLLDLDVTGRELGAITECDAELDDAGLLALL